MYYFDLNFVLINTGYLFNISAKSTLLTLHQIKNKKSEDYTSFQCLAILPIKTFVFMFALMPFPCPTFCPNSPVYRVTFILVLSTTHFHIPLPSKLKHV